ncbi:NADH:flavin oxidoreductase/NADH oxidase [Imleria badia]|nr:NADH:flavin oxidoreductase/NADH oxidase [Imleria badia]
MASTQQTPALFKPIKVGRLTLQHRVVLAPLTRFRAHASHVPGPQQASYYSQRGSVPGSLLITEATFISHDAGGYGHVPGIYTDEQIREWKKVTEAIHARGSYIFLQLWALGRAADIDFLENQDPPSAYVSASGVALTGQSKPPRALTEAEIQEYIATYAKAASNAVHGAGFDGVEIHNANGYLLDEFLQTVSNKRTDRWGGDEEGRTRFSREVVSAVVDAIGEDRVGIRISPWSTFQDMGMSDPRPTFAYLATALRDKHSRLAYLHVVEPRVAGDVDAAPNAGGNNDFLREIWNGGEGGEERVFISAGGYTREAALRTAENKGGLIAFGRLYISNPDLPVRLQENIPLTRGDRTKYYLAGNLTPFGYNDWPFADGNVREIDAKL